MSDTREMIREMLVQFGASVVTASDGLDGLEQTEAHTLDLVLCDIRMPRMDGYEFLRTLRERQGALTHPVVAMSGLASGADHRRAEEAGFDGSIDKPFDDEDLLAVIGAALARRSRA